MKTFYETQIERKAPWKVVKGTASKVMPGAEQCVSRCLELRILELEVAEFLKDGSNREVGRLTPDMVMALNSNIADEVKHDEALSHAASVYNFASPSDTEDAKRLAQQWIDHPDHPIAKTAVLETSIFFVILPIFRFLTGDGGCLRATSMDISNDESAHAAIHRQMAKDLNLDISPSLNRLRRDTVDWMTENLKSPGKYGRKGFWMDSSDSLFERGVAPGLAQTSAYSQPAFFEIRNDNLPSYG